MPAHYIDLPQSVVHTITEHTRASRVVVGEVIQELWSGYGAIVRIHFEGAAIESAILKLIAPPNKSVHPRGWDTDLSHQRKLRSYQVESQWYLHYTVDCDVSCSVPQVIVANNDGDMQWILMEDLANRYPQTAHCLSMEQAFVCLRWLANFHARFLSREPVGLWDTGTYWHLDTRPDEFNAMPEGELKDVATLLDNLLTQCEFQTIVHGDAKVANFCFSADMSQVAAVDFQYVGGGVGIKDVGYFLGSCLTEKSIEENEVLLLNVYFDALEDAIGATHSKEVAQQVRSAWSELYCIAWTDFYRFLEGWMPGHKKINRYTRQLAAQAFKQLG